MSLPSATTPSNTCNSSACPPLHHSGKELFRLAQWLVDHQVKHVAMEATGGYEKPLVNVLQEAGFDVLVTSGANTKNYRRFNGAARTVRHVGCHPHSYRTGGPACTAWACCRPSFCPTSFRRSSGGTGRPALVRLRRSLVEDAANYIRRIQKALRAGNVRLDAVLTDTNSVSGLRIIAAICEGQQDPVKLAELVDSKCKKKPAEIIDRAAGAVATGQLDRSHALRGGQQLPALPQLTD